MYKMTSLELSTCPDHLNSADYAGETWYKYVLTSSRKSVGDVTGWFRGTKDEALKVIDELI